MRELFKRIRARQTGPQNQYTVKCSFVQIYNEQVYDLFNATHLRKFGAGPALNNKLGRGLRVRWSTRGEFYVENLFIHECSSASEVIAHFHAGLRRKIMASHRLNAASSRSHCLFALHVCRGDMSRCEARVPRTRLRLRSSHTGGVPCTCRPDTVVESRLTLVDLAGSERLKETFATGTTMKESIGINRSLFVLRKVITALATLSDQYVRIVCVCGGGGGGLVRSSHDCSLEHNRVKHNSLAHVPCVKLGYGGCCSIGWS